MPATSSFPASVTLDGDVVGPRRRGRRAPAAVVMAITMLIGLGGSVGAHSSLVDSLPVGGETVSTLDEIVLEFGDAVVDDEFLRVTLETPEGAGFTIGDAEIVDPLTIRVDVPEPPPAGTYFVRYRVTSIDGDLGEGGFLFDFDPDAGSGGAATWILLGVGVFAVAGMLLLLRPRGDAPAASGRPVT